MTDIQTQIATTKARMKLPVICAPMFLVTSPDMVINACKSGVMGCLPLTNARTESDLRAWVSKIANDVTDADAPWSVNMITHSSYGRFDAEQALVEEFQPSLVITALGGPHRFLRFFGDMIFFCLQYFDFSLPFLLPLLFPRRSHLFLYSPCLKLMIHGSTSLKYNLLYII